MDIRVGIVIRFFLLKNEGSYNPEIGREITGTGIERGREGGPGITGCMMIPALVLFWEARVSLPLRRVLLLTCIETPERDQLEILEMGAERATIATLSPR
jgi:hypothetical protein